MDSGDGVSLAAKTKSSINSARPPERKEAMTSSELIRQAREYFRDERALEERLAGFGPNESAEYCCGRQLMSTRALRPHLKRRSAKP
jgi:hypothetical protein